ncbi:hypothetical protein Tco_0448130 [Tanacetum coccineum]
MGGGGCGGVGGGDDDDVVMMMVAVVRRCGGSSGGWSGGDGDDMVSVDGDSGGTRGGVEVARGGEWGSRSSRSEEDLHVYRFLCSPEFGRKRWPAADRWSPEK